MQTVTSATETSSNF